MNLSYNKTRSNIVKVKFMNKIIILYFVSEVMKMSNITDIIERYLKEHFKLKGKNVIEIKRNEIAEQFQCVPSQINYVINTRFTEEKGYMIESKRGGGGYIRIIRIKHQDKSELIDSVIKLIQPKVTQQSA